jgi:hypothetical protein
MKHEQTRRAGIAAYRVTMYVQGCHNMLQIPMILSCSIQYLKTQNCSSEVLPSKASTSVLHHTLDQVPGAAAGLLLVVEKHTGMATAAIDRAGIPRRL